MQTTNRLGKQFILLKDRRMRLLCAEGGGGGGRGFKEQGTSLPVNSIYAGPFVRRDFSLWLQSVSQKKNIKQFSPKALLYSSYLCRAWLKYTANFARNYRGLSQFGLCFILEDLKLSLKVHYELFVVF